MLMDTMARLPNVLLEKIVDLAEKPFLAAKKIQGTVRRFLQRRADERRALVRTNAQFLWEYFQTNSYVEAMYSELT